jgi:hypothetical protein
LSTVDGAALIRACLVSVASETLATLSYCTSVLSFAFAVRRDDKGDGALFTPLRLRIFKLTGG